MTKHWQRFIQSMLEKNKEGLNPLYSSYGPDNIYYVLTWLLERYETINDKNNRSKYSEEFNNITKIFASTSENYGTLFHFLAINKEVKFGKNSSIKDLTLKTFQVIQKNNDAILSQLLQSNHK